METSILWTSIILPIIIGPIFIFFKSVYDRYNEHNNTQKLNIYNDTINHIKNKLTYFYWPIYLKLLCIYQLNFNIPPKDEQKFLVSSSSSSSEEEEDFIKFKKKKLRRCKGYYKLKNSEEIFKCKKYIPNSTLKLCRRCKWNYYFSKKDDDTNIDINTNINTNTKTDKNITLIKPPSNSYTKKKKKKKRNSNKIKQINEIKEETNLNNLPKNTNSYKNSYDIKSDTDNEINSEFKEIKTNIEISIPQTSSESDESSDYLEYEDSFTGNGIGVVKTLENIKLDIDDDTISLLKKNIIDTQKEIIKIIETQISIAEPNSKLGKQLIGFIKYCKIREIIEKNDKNYNIISFGTRDNTNKLLSLIETKLFDLQKEYYVLLKNGPYFTEKND